jgi:UPF0716 protein FxsA
MGCLLILLVIVGLPTAEIMVMGKVAAQIGFGDMVVLLILSAVFGSYLAKHQGKVVFVRIQQCLLEGRLPTVEMVDGFLVFLGGLLFVFPGFISDIFGLILIFPLTRWLVRACVLTGFKQRTQKSQTFERSTGSSEPNGPEGLDKRQAVDAEVVE